jgi:hypothetical protein
MLTLTAAITAMTISNIRPLPNLSGQIALLLRSEGTRAQIETDGSHGDRNHQSETAEYRDQIERVGMGLGLCSFASENTGNDRIHSSLLIETGRKLLDRHCRSFSQGKKMASPVFQDRFVGNLRGPPRHAFASFRQA